MNSAETIERVPIHTDADGVVRVAGTRVTLDTIVAAFDAGATAEEIAQQYSSISLADVYSVITYYLRHKTEVSVYLSSFGHTGTTDGQAPVRTPLRCCGLQRTRTSTGTLSEGSFAETRSLISSVFKTWASLVRMTLQFSSGPPTRGASSSRTISRRSRSTHSIDSQQVSRCEGASL